jgi:hypothetical protein
MFFASTRFSSIISLVREYFSPRLGSDFVLVLRRGTAMILFAFCVLPALSAAVRVEEPMIAVEALALLARNSGLPVELEVRLTLAWWRQRL